MLVTPVGVFRPAAGVEMVPADTRRTRPFSESATRKSVALMADTLWGRPMAAAVAGPPSPAAPGWPLPATVVTVPEAQPGSVHAPDRRPARSANR